MKIRICLCSVLAVGLLAFGAGVQANQTMEWVPVSASAPATYAGNEIILSSGGVDVVFELSVSGWGDAPPLGTDWPQLGAYNATIVGTSLLGLNAVPPNPGCDLISPTQVSCAVDTDCPTGICGIYEVEFCDDFQPGYQLTNFCNVTTSQECKPGSCPGGEFCIGNPDWLLGTCAPTIAVSLPPSRNYQWIGACGAGSVADPLAAMYGGTLRLTVPACAKGTYTIEWNPDDELSFLNDENSLRIPGLTLTEGQITVEIGRCCFSLADGNPANCADDVTAGECALMPGPRLWEAGTLCPLSGGPDCAQCLNDSDCKDPTSGQAGPDNLCTSNTCTPFLTCENALLYGPEDCCDPDVGVPDGLTEIDDYDPCTEDICDPDTGDVSHDPAGATGEVCNDGLGCTINDVCDGVSPSPAGCAGTDVNGMYCDGSTPCPVGECDVDVCVCTEDTPLCIDILGKVCEGTTIRCQSDDDCDIGVDCVGTQYPDGNCFDEDDVVQTAVAIGAGSAVVYGVQFYVEYDPACVDLIAESVAPCDGSIFDEVIDLQIDEVAGTIWFAAHVSDYYGGGTRGPMDILCMDFVKLEGCDECDFCLISDNPKNTKLATLEGNNVPLINCECSKPIQGNGVIDLDTPEGEDANAFCNRRFATIEWDYPTASDTCDGELDVTCLGYEAFGGQIAGWDIYTGGDIPQGKYFILCEAENSCGAEAVDVFTVIVSDQQSIDVEVHLSPTMNPGLFSRAIDFELWDDCDAEPTVVCEVIDFGGPFNFAAHGTLSMKIPKGNYMCITAVDNLHTLRAEADLECGADGVWTAVFKGDPLMGGNWLIGGNLDYKKPDGGPNHIDISDFTVFIGEVVDGAAYPPRGDTTCDTESPHGDINADGAVDGLDYAFILENFMMASKGACCPDPTAALSEPLEEISVKELRLSGHGELAVADLNGDGVVNVDDMSAYMQGVVPTTDRVMRKGDVRSSR